MATWTKQLKKKNTNYQNKTTENLHWFQDHSGEVGAYLVPNIINDRFLLPKAADELIKLFYSLDKKEPIDVFIKKYDKVCKQFALTGGEIGLNPYPQKLGRATEIKKISLQISTQNGLDIVLVEKLLRKLQMGIINPTEQQALSSCYMSPYASWVTWDRKSKGRKKPFTFCKSKTSNEIRASLGLSLDLNIVKLPLIVFEYDSSEVNNLFRPTIADSALSLRFTPQPPPPPQERDWYGLTRPWEEDLESTSTRTSDTNKFNRCPEALHERIKFPINLSCSIYYPDPKVAK